MPILLWLVGIPIPLIILILCYAKRVAEKNSPPQRAGDTTPNLRRPPPIQEAIPWLRNRNC
jgi:hypothetical protein